MNYNVKSINLFEKQTKRLIIKYPSLKNELIQLVEELEVQPNQGISIGGNCYKIRLSIASKGKGKSGGARVITNFVINNKTVYLLSIYYKSEKDNLTDTELAALLALLPT